MTTKRKILIAAACLLLIGSLIFAVMPHAHPIVGTWQEYNSNINANEIYTFNRDGTYTNDIIDANGKPFSLGGGTYKIGFNDSVIQLSNGDYMYEYVFLIEGDSMGWTLVELVDNKVESYYTQFFERQ